MLGIVNRPQRIFNVDDKGIRLCVHKPPTVIGKKGAKRVHNQSQEHGENVTVVAYVNTLGNAIPPLILFKGKLRNPEYKDNFFLGAEYEVTPKGSMIAATFVKFLKSFGKYKLSGISGIWESSFSFLSVKSDCMRVYSIYHFEVDCLFLSLFFLILNRISR